MPRCRWSASSGPPSTSSRSTSTGPARSPRSSPGAFEPLSRKESRWRSPSSAPPGYRGAGDARARPGDRRVRRPPPGPAQREYERDEQGQAAYIRELLEVFDAEGVDSAFVFTFALYDFPHRPGGDPRDDLDLASYGIVKVLEDGRTEPKAAFTALARRYNEGG